MISQKWTTSLYFHRVQGSPLFAIRQNIVSPEMTEGTIFLAGSLDFETQSMYHLTLLANVSNVYHNIVVQNWIPSLKNTENMKPMNEKKWW
jgi:hypothetical protein